MEKKVKIRSSFINLNRIPPRLKNVAIKPISQKSWKPRLKALTEAFYKRYWFYHPVKCGPSVFAHRPTVSKNHVETYKCPGGTIQKFKRFRTSKEFFKYKYGRGGEFAQGLHAVLTKLGVHSRVVLGYWPGSDALWVEAWNPWTKRWTTLDPCFKHGYGHKFPKRMTGVIASNGTNRSAYYKLRVKK